MTFEDWWNTSGFVVYESTFGDDADKINHHQEKVKELCEVAWVDSRADIEEN